MSALPQPPSRHRLRRLVGTSLLRPFNDPAAIDDVLGRVNRLWSLGQARGRVMQVIRETADTCTFVIKANRHWRGAAAGQHLLVEMEIDGVRQQRAFSLSSPCARGERLRLTIKAHAGGNVTRWMHEHLRVGAVVGLGAAAGTFVLPDVLPDRILMLGAGSGITPINAMLHALHARGYTGDVVLLHASCHHDDAIFGASLQALADRWPALTRIAHRSDSAGFLDPQSLAAHVPDHASRSTFLCGPSALMDWVTAHYGDAGADALLHSERFGLPRRVRAEGDTVSQVHCTDAATVFTTAGDQPLLAAAEAGGMTPRYGCRMGICRTCQCRKRSGTVENLLTGEVSSAPGQLIQLCISAARSDLELEV